MPTRSSYGKMANAKKLGKSAVKSGAKSGANRKAAGVRAYAGKTARRRSVSK